MTAVGEITKSVSRETYEPIVRGLRPFVGEEELKLRSSLLYIRDRAMATKQYPDTCEPAWSLLDVAERQASDWAMNHRIDVEGLEKLRKACLTCIAAAAEFDALFTPTLPLDEGEANGRGA